VDVLVQRKFKCCPGLHPKYSGVVTGRNVAELFAVMSVVVLSMVAQIPAARV
jgi:hypothetical protein